MNHFTDATREARIKIGLDWLCDTLRAPETLHRLVMEHKPAVQTVGDFTLKALLDSIIAAHVLRGDYRGVQRLLGTLFGPAGAESVGDVTGGTRGADRHAEGKK